MTDIKNTAYHRLVIPKCSVLPTSLEACEGARHATEYSSSPSEVINIGRMASDTPSLFENKGEGIHTHTQYKTLVITTIL